MLHGALPGMGAVLAVHQSRWEGQPDRRRGKAPKGHQRYGSSSIAPPPPLRRGPYESAGASGCRGRKPGTAHAALGFESSPIAGEQGWYIHKEPLSECDDKALGSLVGSINSTFWAQCLGRPERKQPPLGRGVMLALKEPTLMEATL